MEAETCRPPAGQARGTRAQRAVCPRGASPLLGSVRRSPHAGRLRAPLERHEHVISLPLWAPQFTKEVTEAQGGWGDLLEVTQRVKTQSPKLPVLVLFSQTSMLPGATGGIETVAQAAGWQQTLASASGRQGGVLETVTNWRARAQSQGTAVPQPARSRSVGAFGQSTCFCKQS